MLQIRIEGRGGQGAQMAGQVLATAFFREGNYIQSFASYGGARRGTPVRAFLRVDEHFINLRCDIEKPDAILCFDATLLDETLLGGATLDTRVLVNSSKSPQEFSFEGINEFELNTVDGGSIAWECGLGRIVNSALMGAFAGLIDAPQIDNLLEVVKEMSPVKIEENVNSCLKGYEITRSKRGLHSG